ncbi:MAG TPA: hypothetical protein VGB53_01950 [Rubricoccaceae bacterium]|jgi:hypothetical protein
MSRTSQWFGEATVARQTRGALGAIHALRAEARASGPVGTGGPRWVGTATADLHRGSLSAGYERGQADAPALYTLSALAITPAQGPPALQQWALTLGAGFGAGGVGTLQAGATHPLGRTGSVGFRSYWRRETGAPSAVLTLNLRLGALRVQTRTAMRPGEAATATVGVDGTLTYSRQAGVTALPQRGTGYAGLSGHIFYDHDGDGAFGPGDEPAPAARIAVGGRGAVSDISGAYSMWFVPPYQMADVRVDSTQGIEPGWAPRDAVIRVRPTPHLYNRVDIPLERVREVVGRVVLASGRGAPGGITVELRETTTGRVLRSVTFSDGTYYLPRCCPGAYEVRIAASSLEALGAGVEPATVTLFVPAAGQVWDAEAPPILLVLETDRTAGALESAGLEPSAAPIPRRKWKRG